MPCLKYFPCPVVCTDRNLSKMKNTEIVLRTYDCTGCGRCVEACRRGVLRLADNGQCRFVQVADAARCAGCRACERSCRNKAIVIRKIEPRKTAPKHILRGALPIVLALALALPWSSDPEAWQAVNYWKIFGLLVLFHLIFCHLQIPEFLKNNNKP